MTARLLVSIAIVAAAGACAAYHPVPVDVAAFPASYAARSIHDSAFVAYFASLDRKAAEAWWTPEDYAMASLYFRSGLDEARSQVRVAQAAEGTAGARQRPGLTGSGERNLQHSDEKSPWGAQLTPTFVVEFGGKRGARIAIARANTLAATARLRVIAWQMANEAREAAFASLSLFRSRDAAARELQKLDSVVPLIEARYAEGGLTQTEVARAHAETDRVHIDALRAQGDWKESLVRLATLAGLPPGALPEVAAATPHDSLTTASALGPNRAAEGPVSSCAASGTTAAFSRDSSRVLALSSRWEVAEALAEYQVAEGEVRLAVAEQRPDLQLGPGLFFDHGVTRFLVNFALPFLPGGNQGRILEAEARRRATAAHLDSVQERILADVDQAYARCGLAETDRDSALRLTGAAHDHARAVASAFARGEIGRLELAQAVLEDSRTDRALDEFESRLAEARAALEAAAGVWYTRPDALWPDVTIQPQRTGSKEPP